MEKPTRGGQEKREPDEFCNGRKPDGTYCRNRAGFKTSHVGTGRCVYHGGSVTGRPPSQETTVKRRISARADELVNDPNLMDMRPVIAMARAAVEVFKEQIDQGEKIGGADFERFMLSLDTVGKQITRAEEIINKKRVTPAELHAFCRAMLVTAHRYISNPQDLRAFVQEVESYFGAPQLTQGQPPPARVPEREEEPACPTLPLIRESENHEKGSNSALPPNSDSNFLEKGVNSGVPHTEGSNSGVLVSDESVGPVHPDIIFLEKPVDFIEVDGEVE